MGKLCRVYKTATSGEPCIEAEAEAYFRSAVLGSAIQTP